MRCESFERTSASDTDCLDLDGVHYFVALVVSNKDHALADPCQRLALLVKYTHVERVCTEVSWTTFCGDACRQASNIGDSSRKARDGIDRRSIWSSVSSGYMGRLRISSASCSATEGALARIAELLVGLGQVHGTG